MYLAIDIGGTKTLIALFSNHGRVVKKLKFKTSRVKNRFMNDLIKNLKGFSYKSIKMVVVAIPGVVQKNCSVVFGNRQEWGELNLSEALKNLFDCPIHFANDANLATVYEGSFYKKGRTVFLTFSTGIGGGILEHGRISPESDKFEPGHVLYEFNGKVNEWEDIAAASAIGKAYHVDTATDLIGKATMEDIAKRITLGLSDIVREYHPDTIVLGGPLGKIFKRYVKYLPDLGVKYVRPKRPLESVIYGCYIYAKQIESEKHE